MPSSRIWSKNSSTSIDPRRAASLTLYERLNPATRDPNVFVEYCFRDPLGKPIRQSRVHQDLQAFLSANSRALIELPRDHGKSMQVCTRIIWELARQPGLRVKIVCASEALAAERGRFIREAIEHNERLPLVFPELRPSKPWSDTRFTVQRPANVIGTSVAAIGVGAASTGTRADLLVCDDIVDVRSIQSRAERQRIKEYFRDNLMNLLEPDGRFWGLSTPWHREDLNGELKKNSAYALFREAIGDDLTPVWPERWTRERLEERRQAIGNASFARGYRLVPQAEEEAVIQPGWVRLWTKEVESICTVLAIDPAVSTKSKADCSALVTLRKTPENEVHCLEAIARRVSAPDLVALIDETERRWQPDVILFESNAAFRGICDLLIRHARFGPKVKGIDQSKDKGVRVVAWSITVQNGSFQLRGLDGTTLDPAQQALFDEMTAFPVGEHDDLVDAAALGTKFLLDLPEPRVWAP